MKKFITLLITIIFLNSCAKEAEKITVKDQRTFRPSNQYVLGDVADNFDPTMRSASMILIPNEEDFSARTKYSYENGSVTTVPNDQSKDFSWDGDKDEIDVNGEVVESKIKRAFQGTQFEGKLPSRISAQMSGTDKRRIVTTLAVAAGEIRDVYYVKVEDIERRKTSFRNQVEEKYKEESKPYIDTYLCFNPRANEQGGHDCDFIEPSDNPDTEGALKAKSCQEIEDKFNYTDRTAARKIRREIRNCKKPILDELRSWESLPENDSAPMIARRAAAKGLVEEILTKLKTEYTGIDYLLYARTKEDSEVEHDKKSKLVFENGEIVSVFINLDVGVGFNIYVPNLRARNLEFYRDRRYSKDGVQMMRMNLDLKHNRTLEANLSATDTKAFGLRYTGELLVEGIDGKIRTGAMKLEFDRKK